MLIGLMVLSLLVGGGSGYFIRQSIARKRLDTAEGKIEKMTEEAEKKSQDLVLSAKNKAVEILEEAKKKEKEREDQILRSEQRLEKREVAIDQKTEEIEQAKKEMDALGFSPAMQEATLKILEVLKPLPKNELTRVVKDVEKELDKRATSH